MLQHNKFNKVIKRNGYCIDEFENSKTSDSHRLLLNLSDKKKLNNKEVINMLLHQILTYKKVLQK